MGPVEYILFETQVVLFKVINSGLASRFINRYKLESLENYPFDNL